MTNAARLCAVLLITTLLLSVSGCNTFPILESCITCEGGMLCCVDKRLPKEQQEYTRPAHNDICTNPDDANTGMNWVKEHDR